MKKELIAKILFIASIVLLALFFVFVFMDYGRYNETYSAPFSALILYRVFQCVLPAIILSVIGLVLKRKK